MTEAAAEQPSDAWAVTIAVGSSDLGKTFCSIVVNKARLWPWETGVNLIPGPTSGFLFEADGPLFGRGVEKLDSVELVSTDRPDSLLWVDAPRPQQPNAPTRVCADDFVLTVNEAWRATDEDESWLKLPEEVTVRGAEVLVKQRAALLVSTNTMGRAWMQLPVSGGRGRLVEAPAAMPLWPFKWRR